jgi:hypothetical protein
MSNRRSPNVVILVGLLLLLAVPALAGSAAITNGIDLWRTPANGGTFVDFAQSPLPAGFFCAGSAPFSGRIVFTGVPVMTNPASVLGQADTIVQRLDDAVFTKNAAIRPFALRESNGAVRTVTASSFRGQEVATTRIQVKAISFASVRPAQTGCGAANVTATLAGEQPTTEMVILRDHDKGGRFYAPLSLNVRLTFTPVNGGAPVEVLKAIQFPAKPLSVWSEATGRRASYAGFVGVDTDLNGAVDLMVPGTSNFAAGFKDVPARGRGAVEKVVSVQPIIVPYCNGTGRDYAVHCHGTVPVEFE